MRTPTLSLLMSFTFHKIANTQKKTLVASAAELVPFVEAM